MGTKSQFGYIIHSIIDKEHPFIRRFDTTTASVHYVRSISRRKERPSTAIKGISGLVPFASMDKTMRRSVRGHPISTKDKRRNSAISRVRSLVERPFDVIKRVFHSGHLMVTTHLRAQARLLFTCFSYNLFNLVSIRNRQIQR
jgi:IS5 family transposase